MATTSNPRLINPAGVAYNVGFTINSVEPVSLNQIKVNLDIYAKHASGYGNTTNAVYAKVKDASNIVLNTSIDDYTDSNGYSYPAYLSKYDCYRLKKPHVAMTSSAGKFLINVDAYLPAELTDGCTQEISVTFFDYFGNAIKGSSSGYTVTSNTDQITLPSITVTYHKNDGTGATATQSFTINGDATHTINGTVINKNKFGYTTAGGAYFGTFDGAFGGWNHQKSGYTLLGWATTASSTTIAWTTYSDVTDSWIMTYSPSKALYAVWSKNITLTYNANGGSGAPSSQSATIYNSTLSNTFTLSETKPVRNGYEFLGWSTSSIATAASIQPGASYTLSDSTTLYAVWKKKACFMIKDNNTVKNGMPWIKVNGVFKEGKIVYMKVNGQWIEA